MPQNWSAFLEDLLTDFFPGYSFLDLKGDIQNIVGKIYKERITDPGFAAGLQILDSLFYRNKAVYIIGRFLTKEGTLPFVLPVIHHPKGLYVDACLLDSNYLRIIFSYTRAYFMVDTPIPSLTIAFLLSIMPGKDLAEIYNSIGHPKHGKTEQYRLLLQELELNDEQFEIAPGIPGLVMMVFTLPSYNLVFKLIRDAADPPKETNRSLVEQKYKLVKKLDRVGRMADTHEYAFFKIKKDRFSDDLLKELHRSIPSQIHEENGYLVFRHLYTERKSIPLNIFLEQAGQEQALEAALDYGYAIKEMAAANVFPGDMLTKNFGVTRHGRCIFYDYDEIVLLTRCHFREKPKAETFEQIYAARPWYDIGPDDVFPEEFRYFMIGREDIRDEFNRVHGDLFTAQWWQEMQKKIRNGDFLHTFPYPIAERFDDSREV
jgi:isocitrate dehydrogenase kinase/phosphatase